VTSADLKESVYEAVAETLESMVFMEAVLEEPGDPESLGSKPLGSSIVIKQPFTARATLYMPIELARELTMNILGAYDEEILSDEIVRDALAELINTIAGRLMAKLTPEDQTFELGLPEPVEGGPPETGGNLFFFDVDEGRMALMTEGEFNA
jgi:CheY-specific phosphatase CheX